MITVGDRFESQDLREVGRVVEVVRNVGLEQADFEAMVAAGLTPSEWESERCRNTYFHVRTEQSPLPTALGNVSRVAESTLLDDHYYERGV